MTAHAIKANIPPRLAARIAEAAERKQVSTNAVVSEALTDWLALEDRRHRMTLDAMASVDAGRFVEHEEVLAWIDSLDSDDPLPLPTP